MYKYLYYELTQTTNKKNIKRSSTLVINKISGLVLLLTDQRFLLIDNMVSVLNINIQYNERLCSNKMKTDLGIILVYQINDPS